MRVEDFQKLIADAELNLHSKWAPRFVVSLHVPTTYGIRVQCETLSYEPAEFAMLTPERAKQQIEACKRSLEKEAKKKMGVAR